MKGNMKISEKEKAVAKRPLKIENSEKPIRKATPMVKSRKKTINSLFLYKSLFIKNKIKQIVVMAILNMSYVLYMAIGAKGDFFQLVGLYSIQLYSILALPIIYVLYNNMIMISRSKKDSRENNWIKLLKYSIYPVHMLMIYGIRILFFSI